jgi:hypothetical protein
MDTQGRSRRAYSVDTNNNPCSIREQLVRRESCYLGNSLKHFHRRRLAPVLDVADGRLANLNAPCELRLRQARPLPIRLKCLHMDCETIGVAYSDAIGHTNSGFQHAFHMAKQLRSVYERAMEALTERFPREKPTQGKLAQVAGIKQPSVNDWKDGYPAMETAVRTATALGVCVEWLLTERGPKHPPQSSDPTLAMLLSQLDDRQKTRLAKLAELLKDDK